ncbi:MAG: pyridoxamine 5'-phosphate oxidase family protein [Gammaproteobacteria bacterium]|nr:pyridoxamine 5'-phosphate oxidase family protein [Gammaproteobacteria bacterium]
MPLVEDYAGLVRRHFAGVLATHCTRRAGYPFASRVPYCADAHGYPLLAISALAQHTRNLRADARVAMSVWDEHPDDVQAAGRATLVGDIESANGDEVAAYYTEHFPNAARYLRHLDFSLYRLRVQEVHYIAGFAKVHWLSAEHLAGVPAWSPAEQTQARATIDAEKLRVLAADDTLRPVLAGIDPQGLTLRLDQSLRRVAFPNTLQDPLAVAAAVAQTTR